MRPTNNRVACSLTLPRRTKPRGCKSCPNAAVQPSVKSRSFTIFWGWTGISCKPTTTRSGSESVDQSVGAYIFRLVKIQRILLTSQQRQQFFRIPGWPLSVHVPGHAAYLEPPTSPTHLRVQKNNSKLKQNQHNTPKNIRFEGNEVPRQSRLNCSTKCYSIINFPSVIRYLAPSNLPHPTSSSKTRKNSRTAARTCLPKITVLPSVI